MLAGDHSGTADRRIPREGSCSMRGIRRSYDSGNQPAMGADTGIFIGVGATGRVPLAALST